jgi:hypothetical protein
MTDNVNVPDLDSGVPHIARVYDYWLGGKDNFAADRELAEQIITAYPDIVFSVRANRDFLARSVRFLVAERGIRQFLDIGTGIPTADNTHEVAQRIAPECKIVYVDNDAIVLSHAQALLKSSPAGKCAYIDADLRDPASLLAAATQTLDFTKPVAVMLIAAIHFITDDDAASAVAARLPRPPGCAAATVASVMTAIGMACSAGSARICASGYGRLLVSPRRCVAHYHDEDVQQHERYSIEEQARDDRRDRRAVAVGEVPAAAPGPERVADTKRLPEWHLGAPGHVRAAVGKVTFGHRVAVDAPGHAAAGLTVRHGVEGVPVLRADHICPRVHLGGQDKRGDTSHRDEHEDAEHPAAMVVRRKAMRVSVQRVMRNAALRAHPDGRVGAVNA